MKPVLTTEQRKLLNRIIRWLAAGAPHKKVGFEFNMHNGIVVYDESDDMPDDCGTSCCIAGAAIAFGAPGVFEKHLSKINRSGWQREAPWPEVCYIARTMLGLRHHEAAAIFAMEAGTPQAAANNLREWRDRGTLPTIDSGISIRIY
jgi:hypothetical protein